MQAVLRTLIALSVFGGALLFLCPAGGVRRVMGMLFTAVLVTAAVAPVHGFDYDLFSLGEAKFNSAEAEIMLNSAKSETLLKKLLLQKNCERWLEEQASKHGAGRVGKLAAVRGVGSRGRQAGGGGAAGRAAPRRAGDTAGKTGVDAE